MGRGAREWVGDRGRSGTLGDSRGLPRQSLLEARGAGSKAEERDGDCQVRALVAAVWEGGPATRASFSEVRDSLLLSEAARPDSWTRREPGAAGLLSEWPGRNSSYLLTAALRLCASRGRCSASSCVEEESKKIRKTAN